MSVRQPYLPWKVCGLIEVKDFTSCSFLGLNSAYNDFLARWTLIVALSSEVSSIFLFQAAED